MFLIIHLFLLRGVFIFYNTAIITQIHATSCNSPPIGVIAPNLPMPVSDKIHKLPEKIMDPANMHHVAAVNALDCPKIFDKIPIKMSPNEWYIK